MSHPKHYIWVEEISQKRNLSLQESKSIDIIFIEIVQVFEISCCDTYVFVMLTHFHLLTQNYHSHTFSGKGHVKTFKFYLHLKIIAL